MARDCFERAINLYGLNFKYYLNLIDTYQRLGLVSAKIKELQSSENIYDRIQLGILYIKNSEVRKGIIILDEICTQEPDILIIPTLQKYIKDVLKG